VRELLFHRIRFWPEKKAWNGGRECGPGTEGKFWSGQLPPRLTTATRKVERRVASATLQY
jgi:hypothetical protein